MANPVRRRAEEKELRMAGNMVGSRAELEARGMTFMGSLRMAAGQGYLTPGACERAGQPAPPGELQGATHFAMMCNCYADLCLVRDGKKVRPCIPVLFREREERG
jgi:hypothetical protein